MKIWIIILVIIYVVLKFVQNSLEHIFYTNKEEQEKYLFNQGVTDLSVTAGIVRILRFMDLIAVIILVLLYVL